MATRSSLECQKKKKLALAAVGVAVVALSLGLGLGLGLPKDDSSANKTNDLTTASGAGGLAGEEIIATEIPTDAPTIQDNVSEGEEDTTGGIMFTPSDLEDDSPKEDTSLIFTPPAEETIDVVETVEAIPAPVVTVEATPAPVVTVEATPAPVVTPPPPVVVPVAAPEPAPVEDVVDASNAEIFDAVIIGAGWAGIRAVETLLKGGITNTIVLEANDYVGGRCWSKNSDGSENNPNMGATTIPYDLGAEYTYDSGINVQQDVLWEDKTIPGEVWETEKFAAWPTWPGIATYFQQEKLENGEVITEQIVDGVGLGLDGDGMLDYVWETFIQYRVKNLEQLKGKSYGEAIEQYVEEDGWTDDEALQYLNLIEDAKHIEYGTGDYGMDITHIEFMDPGFHVKTSYMGIPGVGWGNTAAKYASQFDSKIKTNAKVTEINSEDDDEYAIVTYKEGGVTKVVKAKTVLVTVSIGVLKAGNINFVPALPDWKQTSIDNMGFGVINKCIMSWNNQADLVWPENELWFLLATPEDETSGEWTVYSNPSKYKGVPSLTGWIGGKDAIEAEDKSDDQIMFKVMKNLKAMFPNISEPDNVIITRWGKEENVLGAYSFPTPGEPFYEDVENMGWPLDDGKVFFAGEATTANGWASTFGAWDSGEETAGDMMEKLRA